MVDTRHIAAFQLLEENIECTNKNQKDRHFFHGIIAIVMWHSKQFKYSIN